MLKIAIPKGSLEEGTFNLFRQADLPIRRRSERDYNLSISDPRISEAFMLRPQEIASYVSEGEFDLGITGKDWVVETAANVKEIADLQFSRGGWSRVKIVLATSEENPIDNPTDISSSAKVVTEYPQLTRRFFRQLGKREVRIRLSYGATEVKVPRLADYLVDVTETGRTLRENGKKIIATLMESSTKLIANPNSLVDPAKKQAIDEIVDLLLSVIRARDKVLIKMNIGREKLDALIAFLPSLKSPTIAPLYRRSDEDEELFMVETVVEKPRLNIILPEIKKIGAMDILEIDVAKVFP